MSDPIGPDLSGLRRLSPDAPPAKPPRQGPHPVRVVVFLVAVAVVIAVPWFVFTRAFRPGAPKPSPSASASSPSPTASGNPVAGEYEVTGDVKCARVRAAPGTDQVVLDCLNVGVRVRSDGRSEEADGFTWLHVNDPFKHTDGWMATKYLSKL